jgi:hypothetical protein
MRLYSVAIVVEARTTSSDTVDAIMPSIYIELRAAFVNGALRESAHFLVLYTSVQRLNSGSKISPRKQSMYIRDR